MGDEVLTVRELKRLLADWPEVDADGELTTVWVEVSRGLSRQAVAACPLSGSRTESGAPADLLIESRGT